MKKVAVYILSICLLFVSCLSTKAVESPVGTIEYKGEVISPPVEENSTETILEGVGMESEVVLTDSTTTDIESVEYSTTSVESATPEILITEAQGTNLFKEMTEEEKIELTKTTPDATDVNYVYKPESDVAKIGNVDIPKWFAYLCTGIIIAMLIAMCYISNQNKKKMYYGRRD